MLYDNDSAFLVVVPLYGMNVQRLRLTWRNEGQCGVLKVRMLTQQSQSCFTVPNSHDELCSNMRTVFVVFYWPAGSLRTRRASS